MIQLFKALSKLLLFIQIQSMVKILLRQKKKLILLTNCDEKWFEMQCNYFKSDEREDGDCEKKKLNPNT